MAGLARVWIFRTKAGEYGRKGLLHEGLQKLSYNALAGQGKRQSKRNWPVF